MPTVLFRLILFLQQSSVEWASSLWLRVVQEVDPHFQRTVRSYMQDPSVQSTIFRVAVATCRSVIHFYVAHVVCG